MTACGREVFGAGNGSHPTQVTLSMDQVRRWVSHKPAARSISVGGMRSPAMNAVSNGPGNDRCIWGCGSLGSHWEFDSRPFKLVLVNAGQ